MSLNPEQLARDIFHAMETYVGKKTAPLIARLDELERRAAKSVCYNGVWNPETEYQRGDCVTFRGGLWIATSNTKCVRPGDGGGTGWQLAVKRGDAS